MYGQITKFRPDLGLGIIAAENGRKYRFAKGQIHNCADPLLGQGVDFQLVASTPARIVMLAGSPWSALANIGKRR